MFPWVGGIPSTAASIRPMLEAIAAIPPQARWRRRRPELRAPPVSTEPYSRSIAPRVSLTFEAPSETARRSPKSRAAASRTSGEAPSPGMKEEPRGFRRDALQAYTATRAVKTTTPASKYLWSAVMAALCPYVYYSREK